MKTRKGEMKMWTKEKIKQLRTAYGETQEDFCRRLGVALGTLRHWEQGCGKPIGPARILLARLEEDLLQGQVEQSA